MKCWYCQEVIMDEAPELGKGWFQCSICGATWIGIPKPDGWAKISKEPLGSPRQSKYKPSRRATFKKRK